MSTNQQLRGFRGAIVALAQIVGAGLFLIAVITLTFILGMTIKTGTYQQSIATLVVGLVLLAISRLFVKARSDNNFVLATILLSVISGIVLLVVGFVLYANLSSNLRY